MLSSRVNARGFSIVAVTGAVTVISLLMMAAWPLVQDQSRRAALSADHALALQEAERALIAGECDIAIATGTPSRNSCVEVLDAKRATALNPVTLAGFAAGECGQNEALGLCWPLQGQSAQELSKLLDDNHSAKPLQPAPANNWREPAHPPRYVIEPIPDALPSQWIHAGAARAPSLFRITAVGFGHNKDVNVMLQTVYRPQAVAS